MERINLFFLSAAITMLAFAGPVQASAAPPPCHTVTLSQTGFIACFGGSGGSVRATINKAGNYKVIWSNGEVINTTNSLIHNISGLTAGIYDIQVIDLVSGCSAFDIINVTQPAMLTTSLVTEHVKCYGLLTGKIDLSYSGGNSGIQYQWSNGATSQDLISIPAGDYAVTVSDNKGCVAMNAVTVTQPDQALGHSFTSQNPSCYNFTDGSIDITVWGGTTPYTYAWTNGMTSQDLINLGENIYHETITDAKGCQDNVVIVLTHPPQLSMTSQAVDNLCYGEALGRIDLNLSGGTEPYSYQWANSEYLLAWTSEDLIDLPNDHWFVTITDAQACVLIDSMAISSPLEIRDSIVSTNVTSFGGIDGSITLSVNGGVVPYTFLWSNGEVSQNLSGIAAGTYIVTVTDANLCMKTDTVVITQPLAPLEVKLTATDLLCFGGSYGTVSSVASGGTPPYTYLWSTQDTTTFITGLTAGMYILTIFDHFGYDASDTAFVRQPDMITFNSAVTNVSCNGFANGAIDVTPSGGTPPYRYTWRDSDYVLAALTEDITGMQAGQYYLEVSDTFLCAGNVNIEIYQPAALILTLEHTDAYCAGSATGTINGIVNGGTGPYHFLWSDGNESPTRSALYAGTYYVTVTDLNSCLVADSVVVSEADSIRIEYISTPVSCIDQHDGKIEVSVTGGNGNYSYHWSNEAKDPVLDDLETGLYKLTVTDLMGCTAEIEIMVEKIEIACINIPTCFTPNGDGMNDSWRIKDADLYPEFFLEVYNRWGQVVYSRQGSYEPWDGTFNSKELPPETYYYFLKITDQSPVMKGNVTIIR